MPNPGERSELSRVSLPERSMPNPGEGSRPKPGERSEPNPGERSELSRVSLPGVAPGAFCGESL